MHLKELNYLFNKAKSFIKKLIYKKIYLFIIILFLSNILHKEIKPEPENTGVFFN